MSVRSLNKAMLIGNLTRDPELRYTPAGTAVCSFGLATNRSWTTESGEKKDEAEFHRIVAWNKLAELCSQLLKKGRKVYVEGRLQTRSWQAQDGAQKSTTEIVIDDMIILDSKRDGDGTYERGGNNNTSSNPAAVPPVHSDDSASIASQNEDMQEESKESPKSEDVNPDDIPF